MAVSITFDTYCQITKNHPDWQRKAYFNEKINVVELYDERNNHRVTVAEYKKNSYYIVI